MGDASAVQWPMHACSSHSVPDKLSFGPRQWRTLASGVGSSAFRSACLHTTHASKHHPHHLFPGGRRSGRVSDRELGKLCGTSSHCYSRPSSLQLLCLLFGSRQQIVLGAYSRIATTTTTYRTTTTRDNHHHHKRGESHPPDTRPSQREGEEPKERGESHPPDTSDGVVQERE